MDRLLLLQRDAVVADRPRQREQRRRPARHQAQREVVLRQPAREVGDALRGAPAGLVGHRVRGFDDLDAPRCRLEGRRNVAVTRDDQARQGRAARPRRVDRRGHRAARLAGAEHQRAACRRARQEGGDLRARHRLRDRGVEQRAQKATRVGVGRRQAHRAIIPAWAGAAWSGAVQAVAPRAIEPVRRSGKVAAAEMCQTGVRNRGYCHGTLIWFSPQGTHAVVARATHADGGSLYFDLDEPRAVLPGILAAACRHGGRQPGARHTVAARSAMEIDNGRST